MPFRRPLEVLGEEVRYDTGDYMGLLDRVLAHVGWERLKAQLAARRAKGELVGAGIAMYVEKSGLGPSDGVRIAVDTAGAVEVVTGGASNGQGFETVIAQVAAEAIGVDYAEVRVVHGQTDRIAFGLGAHASRATVMTASATHVAARKLRAKALDMAGELMQAAPDDLDIADGVVTRRAGGASMPLGAVAAALEPGSRVLHGRDPGLAAEGWHHTAHQVYPYGSHVAVVTVDRDTGAVAVERYVIGYDVGRAINPMLVEGQVAGGFAQGFGGALMEAFCYSARGDPLAVTFADYLMPTAAEAPRVEIILTEDFPSRPQSARDQGRRRKRHHRGRRRNRECGRGRTRHAGRHHRAADHAAAAPRTAGAQVIGASVMRPSHCSGLAQRHGSCFAMGELAKILDIGWLRHQIALHLVAEFVGKKFKLRRRLDALRQHRQAEPTPEAEHRAHDRGSLSRWCRPT